MSAAICSGLMAANWKGCKVGKTAAVTWSLKAAAEMEAEDGNVLNKALAASTEASDVTPITPASRKTARVGAALLGSML